MKALNKQYQSETLQQKWEAAVNYLRTGSKCGWILDKVIGKKHV